MCTIAGVSPGKTGLSRIALYASRTKVLDVPDNYLTEINLAAFRLHRQPGERLQRGGLLMIDYGFPHAEYYHPQRNQGTLMCHYRHFAHGEPFYWPGLQDITAMWISAPSPKRASITAAKLLGFTTQANF